MVDELSKIDKSYRKEVATLIPFIVGVMWIISLLARTQVNSEELLAPTRNTSLIYVIVMFLVFYVVFLLLSYVKKRNEKIPK